MSTLVAGIVHDFRNVLTTMIGYAEVLHMSDDQHMGKDQLHAIIEAGERGSEMVSHLLTLGRKDGEQTQASATGEQLVAPLENILGLARLQLPAHVQLNCQLEKPLPDVNCSILEIEQIMLNLTHNAAYAIADEGQIDVYLGAAPEHALSQPEHPALCIRVSDTGCGISDEDLDAIFKPFWTSRKKEGGSGLGLAMVERIVNQRKGSIEVTSHINQGSTFTIHLPPYTASEIDQPSTDRPKTNNHNSNGEGSEPTKACHILLVDDAPDVLNIHQTLLERLGHTTMTAKNGHEALEIFHTSEQKIDLIITDYRMPVMDGLEFIVAVRKEATDIPIIMITAFGEDEKLQQAANHDVHLAAKPLTLDKLEQCIKKVLK